jgi:tetratricopeptide (TPR) repeat protein
LQAAGDPEGARAALAAAEGVATLTAAARAAIVSRHDELLADAWLALAMDAGPWHERPAEARLAMGLLMVEQLGDLDGGEALLKDALRVYRQVYGAQSLQVGQVEQALAQARMVRGEYADALVHAERVLAIYERHFAQEHPRRGAALLNIGVMRFFTRDFAGSAAAYRRALAIMEPSLGAEHVDVGLARSNLGETLLALGQAREARAELAAALAILQRAWGAEGAEHFELALPLKGLGLAHLALGQPREALSFLERAVALRAAA